MPLLIKNADIITATQRYMADLLCRDETISAIGGDIPPPSPDTTVIDAAGMYVFPGFIDPHVHIHLPFAGTYAKDTYETGGRAALLGGTTCFIDFVTPDRNGDLLESLACWHEKSRERCPCDYTFHMTVTHYSPRIEEQLRRIVQEEGITSFKIYLAYKGASNIEDEDLFRTLELARELDVLVAGHCENAALISLLQERLLAAGHTEPRWHYESRPPQVEAMGVRHFTTFAELARATVYVVHTSCAEALEEINRARNRGVRAHAETCIQYLLLDSSRTELPDFEGAKYVLSPPLRHASDQEALWRGLQNRHIDTLATDHAPTDFATQKAMGRHDFSKITNGLPGLEDRIRLLYTHGVEQERISLHRFVEVASTAPAQLFGLYPQKGDIRIGADADLVIYDPRHRATITAATHHMNVDYNPYEGMPVSGRPDTVILRGRVVVRNGTFVEQAPQGRFIPRTR